MTLCLRETRHYPLHPLRGLPTGVPMTLCLRETRHQGHCSCSQGPACADDLVSQGDEALLRAWKGRVIARVCR